MAVAVSRTRTLAVGVTAAVAVQGVTGSWQLARLGRGHVREALAHMAADGGGGPVIFGGDQHRLDDVGVGYYAASVPGRRAIVDASDAAQPPRWWVLDRDDPGAAGPGILRRRGRTYRLDAAYPVAPPSGTAWDLYRLAAEPPFSDGPEGRVWNGNRQSKPGPPGRR